MANSKTTDTQVNSEESDQILDLSNELRSYLSLDDNDDSSIELVPTQTPEAAPISTPVMNIQDDDFSLTINDEVPEIEISKKPAVTDIIPTLEQDSNDANDSKPIANDNVSNADKAIDSSIIYAAFAPRNHDNSLSSDANDDVTYDEYDNQAQPTSNSKISNVDKCKSLLSKLPFFIKQNMQATIALSLVFVLGIVFFLFKSDDHENKAITPETINALLAQRKKNIIAHKRANENINISPILTWQSINEIAQSDGNTNIKFELAIRTRDNKIESFDILATSTKPSLLTQEEIVQGLLPRLWLKQFQKTNSQTAIINNSTEPSNNQNQFTVSTSAPAYIQDGEISGRVIAECTITGTINQDSIDGHVTISGGKVDPQTSPIGLFRDQDKSDKYAIFMKSEFKATRDIAQKP